MWQNCRTTNTNQSTTNSLHRSPRITSTHVLMSSVTFQSFVERVPTILMWLSFDFPSPKNCCQSTSLPDLQIDVPNSSNRQSSAPLSAVSVSINKRKKCAICNRSLLPPDRVLLQGYSLLQVADRPIFISTASHLRSGLLFATVSHPHS